MGRTGTLRVGAARSVQAAAVTRSPAAGAKLTRASATAGRSRSERPPSEKGEVIQMKRQYITISVLLAASVFVVSAVLAQSQDRYTLTAANGIAFSEFRGYDAWQLIATSQPDDASGCGTSKV